MTYCVQTDIREYALHMNSEELESLSSHLKGVTEPHLVEILNAINIEKYPVNKTGFERKRNIKLCHKCGGGGRIRIANLRSLDYDYEDCPFCRGEGSVIEKTTVSYEYITPYVKNDFAR